MRSGGAPGWHAWAEGMDIPLRKGEKQEKLVQSGGKREWGRAERQEMSPYQQHKKTSSDGLIPWERAAKREHGKEGKDRVSLASSHQSGIEECI